jgi:hypothetical protein
MVAKADGFRSRFEHEPQLVAAHGGAVFLQAAPVESASSIPAMQRLVDDVHEYAPGRTIPCGSLVESNGDADRLKVVPVR